MASKSDSFKEVKNEVATILNKLTYLTVPEQYEAIKFIIKFMRTLFTSVEISKLLDGSQELVTCTEPNLRPPHLSPNRNQRLSPKKRKIKSPEGNKNGPRLSVRSALKRSITRTILHTKSLDETCTFSQEENHLIDDDLKVRSTEKPKTQEHTKLVVRRSPQCRPDKVRENSPKKKKIKPKSGKVKSLKTLCVLCGKINQNFPGLLKHLFEHEGAPRSCICCKKSFANAIGFEYHKVMKLCNTNWSMEMVMQLSNTSVDTLTLKQIIVCPFCSERFTKHFNLRRHLSRKCITKSNLEEKFLKSDEPVSYKFELGKSEKELITCSFCSRMSDAAGILQHMKEVHNFVCKKCDETFYTAAMLKRHMELHKEPVDANHICIVCQASFFTRKNLRLHMKEHSADEIKKSKKGSGDVPKQKTVKCDKCDVYFSNTFSYQRHHKRIHSPVAENPVVCEKCGKKLNGDTSLQNHDRIFHKEFLSCNECEYKTTNRNNLKRHIHTVHGVHGVVERNISCEKCPAEFKLLSTYKSHLRTVHTEERAFNCYVCSASFKIRPQLKRHLVVHQVATFSCPHCPMLFKRTDHRNRHLLSRHKKLLPKNAMKSKRRKVQKAECNQTPSDVVNMSMDQVFSLIDVQSGELVTLSATEMSRNAVLNMSGGELLNADNIPVLWNNLDDTYALEPLLPPVVPSGHNIYPHAQTDPSAYPYIPSGHNLNDHILKPHQSALVSSGSSVQHLSLDARPMSDLSNIVLVDNKTNIITSPILNPVNVMVTNHIPMDQNIAFLHENK